MRRQNGFSLVEVVIALGVFIFSILVLIGFSGPLINDSSAARAAFLLEESDERLSAWMQGLQGDKLEDFFSKLNRGPVSLYSGSLVDWSSFEVTLFTGERSVLEQAVREVDRSGVYWNGPLYVFLLERDDRYPVSDRSTSLPLRVQVTMVMKLEPEMSWNDVVEAIRLSTRSKVYLTVLLK